MDEGLITDPLDLLQSVGSFTQYCTDMRAVGKVGFEDDPKVFHVIYPVSISMTEFKRGEIHAVAILLFGK
jgi:hypothetical protein